MLLAWDLNSAAFIAEYEKLRAEGMEIEQAMIFVVSHEFRLRHGRSGRRPRPPSV
jgi:hypothetical protein